MYVNPNSVDALRSVRRMELKSKSAFCGGFYHESESVLLGGSDMVPDPHFNRVSVLYPEKLDRNLLAECTDRMVKDVPMFLDVPHPVSDALGEFLTQRGYHPTGESRSSMLLTNSVPAVGRAKGLDISLAGPETLDVFLELFLRGFQTPEDLIPLATAMFHDLVPQNLHSGNSRLYLGTYRGEPACTLYLFFEGGEGGINMVSTKESLRGKGLATAMMQRTMEDAQKLGVHLLGLEARWNGAPERLYRKLGFTTICRHEVFTNVSDVSYGL